MWRDFPYEYETGRLAFDVINGGPRLRQWVDDAQADCQELEDLLLREEGEWRDERRPFLLYSDPEAK